MEQTKPKILAVDDTPENLDVIKEILADQYTLLLTTKAELVQKIASARYCQLGDSFQKRAIISA